MPDQANIFDGAYVNPSGTQPTSAAPAESDSGAGTCGSSENAKEAPIAVEAGRYGLGKPRRIKIRARISHDKDS